MAWQDTIREKFTTRMRGNEIILKDCPYCGNQKWNVECNAEKGVFHCWVCGRGGKVEKLLKDAGLPVDNDQWYASIKTVSKGKEELTLKDFIPLKFEDYAKFLTGRGLNKTDVETYQLMLGTKDRYKGKIVIPMYEGRRLVYFVARDPVKHLYCNPSIERESILPYYLGKQHRMTLFLCEGAFDAISVNKLGFSSGVLLGTQISQLQIRKISAFGFKKVVVLLDGDAKRKTLDVADEIKNSGLVVEVVLLNSEDDPNSLYVKDKRKLKEFLMDPEQVTLQHKVKRAMKCL